MDMISYIYDQPKRLKLILENQEVFCRPLIELVEQKSIKKVYLTGSGTSYHAALLMKMYFDKYTNFETTVSIPTFFSRYEKISKNFHPEETMLIGISQSGTSSSTIEAIKKGNSLNIATVALTEDLNSLITHQASVSIHLNCGKEIIPIETRGYTSTIFTSLLLALKVGNHVGNISDENYINQVLSLERDIDQLDVAIEEIEEWYKKNKYELISMEKGAIAGYGFNYVTALEAYLKLYETFHRPLSAHELEELLHGFEMAFDCKQYIFIIAAKGIELENIDRYRNFLSNLTDHHFVITNEKIKLHDKDLYLPLTVNEDFTPILFILPFQILAARNCESIGYNTSVYPHQIRSFAHIRENANA